MVECDDRPEMRILMFYLLMDLIVRGVLIQILFTPAPTSSSEPSRAPLPDLLASPAQALANRIEIQPQGHGRYLILKLLLWRWNNTKVYLYFMC